MLVFTLLACADLPQMDDNSLEAAGIAGSDEAVQAEGTASVAAAAAEGDWTITVDGRPFAWHSASRADLSVLDGRTLRIEVDETLGAVGSGRVLEGDAPVLVASIRDGSEAFGREVWTFGAEIGAGVIVNEYQEETKVRFTDVVVHADDGDVTLLPGEPTAVTIDGARYRATVVAAYRIDTSGHGPMPGCGPSDLLSIELLRADDARDEQPLTRAAERLAPISSCG